MSIIIYISLQIDFRSTIVEQNLTRDHKFRGMHIFNRSLSPSKVSYIRQVECTFAATALWCSHLCLWNIGFLPNNAFQKDTLCVNITVVQIVCCLHYIHIKIYWYITTLYSLVLPIKWWDIWTEHISLPYTIYLVLAPFEYDRDINILCNNTTRDGITRVKKWFGIFITIIWRILGIFMHDVFNSIC